MCGTPAPAVELLQPLPSVPDEFSGADNKAGPSSPDSQRPPHLGLGRWVPVAVVLMALMVITSFLYEFRKSNLPKEPGLAAEHADISEEPKLENVGQQRIVHNPVRRVQHVVATKLGTVQTIDAAKESDPVELWRAVKRGSVSAEVSLANLYLEGVAVPQNCEQAHILLLAASMKGSKSADNSLNSSYAKRCE